MKAIRWTAILPVAIIGALLGKLLGWLSWEAIDLLPFSSASWDAIGISLFQALYCPFAFVLAGAMIAPAFQGAVAIVLAVVYAVFAVVMFLVAPTPNQWLHGIPALVVTIIFAGLSVPSTLEYLASESRGAKYSSE